MLNDRQESNEQHHIVHDLLRKIEALLVNPEGQYASASAQDKKAIENLIMQNIENPQILSQIYESLLTYNQSDQYQPDQNTAEEMTRNQMMIDNLNALQCENLESNLRYALQDPRVSQQLLAQILGQNVSADSNALVALLSQLIGSTSQPVPQQQ